MTQDVRGFIIYSTSKVFKLSYNWKWHSNMVNNLFETIKNPKTTQIYLFNKQPNNIIITVYQVINASNNTILTYQ